MAKITLRVVDDPDPDPSIEAWLDYMSRLSKIADTVAVYIGPADAPVDDSAE